MAISTNNINYRGYEIFIYPGKISGVLAGTVLIAGLLGTLLDGYKKLSTKARVVMILFWFLGTCVVLYSFVFIFDARNGIGIAFIVFSQVVFGMMTRLILGRTIRTNLMQAIVCFTSIIAIFGIVVLFAYQQVKINPGWSTLIDDVKVSVQIYEVSNWQNPRILGYPKIAADKVAAYNTYERAA